ncbi:TPM domain-containing protein [Mariniflexile soesokkakense]|uniref:TPM domain-containing protein n=1 Tax=Mariniflexile soesokkakense TaxID=1343160 RepID=A0ABV0AD28_9FLAO
MKNLVIRFQSQFNKNSQLILFLLITILSFSFSYAQFEIPKKPDFQTSVYDYINLLSPAKKSSLEKKLIKYSDTTSTQIVIATINSTKGENINYLGTKWAHAWGIGQAKEDNGVFILLAKSDKKIAIITGYGVEHLLTDAMSKRIIGQDIIPFFKQDNYYGGLNRGADAIFEVLTGEYKGTRKTSNQNEFPKEFIIILIFIFIIILISISKNRRGGKGGNRGNKSDGFSLLDAIILSNMGRSSGGGFGSGSSGGGFGGGGFGGGFGGGGFGGGGASGGW